MNSDSEITSNTSGILTLDNYNSRSVKFDFPAPDHPISMDWTIQLPSVTTMDCINWNLTMRGWLPDGTSPFYADMAIGVKSIYLEPGKVSTTIGGGVYKLNYLANYRNVNDKWSPVIITHIDGTVRTVTIYIREFLELNNFAVEDFTLSVKSSNQHYYTTGNRYTTGVRISDIAVRY